jgi:hypothetical protein
VSGSTPPESDTTHWQLLAAGFDTASIQALQEQVNGKLDATANAVSATKLKTAREFKVNLESTSAETFDGTDDASPGVDGKLPITNGGTGANTAAGARANLGAAKDSDLGTIANLNTTDKASAVSAINELKSNLGNINTLDTDVATSLVASINSIYAQVNARNAGSHNSIYRGKNLGTSVTAAQWAFIQAGTFTDMYIGDYWVINGITWRIAAFDYWLGFGDTACSTHHIVIVPDENLLDADGSTTHYMNTSNVTTGAYIGSGFRSGTNADNTSNTARSQCRAKAQAAFGNAHILTHREYFANAMSNGRQSSGSWYDSDIDLMNEIMVYGCPVFAPTSDGSTIPANYTIGNSQLPLFKLNHAHICNRAGWWLRDPVSAASFAYVVGNGYAGSHYASTTWVGVRPAFGIC